MFKHLYRRVACRCLWDSDTDNYAQDIFMTVRAGFFVLLSYWKILAHAIRASNACEKQNAFRNYYTTVLRSSLSL